MEHTGQTIHTARLLLRPMLAEDVDGLLGVFGDPKVMDAFNAQPFDRAQMQRWVQRNLAHQEQHGYGLFTIVLKASGAIIGDCGLEHMEIAGTPSVELGYDIRGDHWGQGFATEAAGAVRDYAFNTLALPRLVSLIRQGNNASRRVAEKIGMTLYREIEQGGSPYWVYALARAADS